MQEKILNHLNRFDRWLVVNNIELHKLKHVIIVVYCSQNL